MAGFLLILKAGLWLMLARLINQTFLFDLKTCHSISAIIRLMRTAWHAILAATSYYNDQLENNGKHNVFTYSLFKSYLRKSDYNKT